MRASPPAAAQTTDRLRRTEGAPGPPDSLAAPFPDTSFLNVGGALRFNAFVKNWEGEDDNRNRGGDLAFDTWRIDVDGRRDRLFFSLQYRFYAGYHMLQHGYVGYEITPASELLVGVHQVPFGNLPYASHNWFFSIPYYVGLEDDYDAGLKYRGRWGNWNLALAFYKNSEGSYSGDSPQSARYSYDVVGDQEELNQGNVRLAYHFGDTEVGASAQYGGLYNMETDAFGRRRAAALHLRGDYGRFHLKAESIYMDYDPARTPGLNPQTVTMGAYDFPYEVAAEGGLHVLGLSYSWPVRWGPFTGITAYNDLSLFQKAAPGFRDSQMNVSGFMLEGNGLYVYTDLAQGRSHPWIGPVWSQALADGPGPALENRRRDDLDWAVRFNMNLGYYF